MQQTHQQPATASGTFAIGGDLKVYRLGFGAMRITGKGVWGPPADKQESIVVLRRALELGINLIDTADSYGPEVSENLIAEALYPYPQNVVIATKGGWVRPGPDNWVPSGHPTHLREALEGSLRRLRVNTIDLYQFHVPDPKVPFEDSVGEIAKMQAEGKIRHVGLSNVDAQQLAQARKIVPIVTVQNRYNLTDRSSEELVNICEREGIGFIPWAPLTGGDLEQPGSPLERIAQQHKAKPSQIALAWLLQRSSTILPIPGTASVQHLEENVLGATIKLSQEEFDTLNQVSK
ncbi:aldo/keto reductase [Dictyobacter kobayashii]|uniref:Oxidoreductase n=1 Tax=Dictyobacter kobayashii TaxID=2014872 RepID=A0A402AE10_9CHLR|nr:aldo/keto reductase [Dictyobacter kobayashii]GCE17333.1 oxidoreductase [Dictyobacter kobayashii]